VANTSILGAGTAAGAPSGVHVLAQDFRLEVWGTTLKVTTPGKTEELRYSSSPMLAEDQAFVEAVARRVRRDALAGVSERDIEATIRVLGHICRVLEGGESKEAAA